MFRLLFVDVACPGRTEEIAMLFRYQILEWPHNLRFRGKVETRTQGLDEVINQKCRAGWELVGLYPENTGRRRYRLLFKIPAPELDIMSGFAKEMGHEFHSQREKAAEVLLQALLGLDGQAGFRVQRLGNLRVVVFFGNCPSVSVKRSDGRVCIVEIGGGLREVPLTYDPASGLLAARPAESTGVASVQTALCVLLAEIVNTIRTRARLAAEERVAG